MEETAALVLKLFERLPKAGVQRLIAEHNPERQRGVHLLETSHEEARALLDDVRDTGNLGAVVECLRFVAETSASAARLLGAADDRAFGDCLATHDPRTHMPLLLWMHAGANAADHPRARDDFCVKWAVLTV